MTQVAKASSKGAFDFKGLMKQSASLGTNMGGFVAGHVAYGFVPDTFKTGVKGIMATALMLLLGTFIAFKSTNDHVKQASIGFATYGGIKMINNITGVVPALTTNGVGALPEGISNALKKFIPQLGEAEPLIKIAGMGIHGREPINAVDTDYVFLDGAENAVDEYAAPSDNDLIIPISGAPQESAIRFA